MNKDKKQKDPYFKDLFLSLYNKNKMNLDRVDTGMMIGLSKWISNDPLNLSWLKKIIQYQFYINPRHYFYMLYFGIRKEYREYPFAGVKKLKKEENVFYDKLKYLFNWSEKEFQFNKPILEHLNLRKEWARKVGLER